MNCNFQGTQCTTGNRSSQWKNMPCTSRTRKTKSEIPRTSLIYEPSGLYATSLAPVFVLPAARPFESKGFKNTSLFGNPLRGLFDPGGAIGSMSSSVGESSAAGAFFARWENA